MCGRFTLTVDMPALAGHFQAGAGDTVYSPSYNIAPGKNIPVIVKAGQGLKVYLMRWGLVPHWASKSAPARPLINARAETIGQKPAFRDSFFHRRCLIPADGFYEWKESEGGKIPMRIILPGKNIFALAGIWDRWTGPDGKAVHSCSIITTRANDYLQGIHDRMPVILDRGNDYTAWLDAKDFGTLRELLRPYPGPMTAYPVSPAVNSPRSDSIICIRNTSGDKF